LMPVLVEWSGPGWYDHSSIMLSRKWGDDVLVYTSSKNQVVKLLITGFFESS